VRAGAIIVAAGSGERLGAGMPKAFVRVAGVSLVAWSMRALEAAPSVGPVVVVAPPGAEREMAAALGTGTRPHAIVPGGTSRQRSVAAGIAALPDGLDAIAVHDAARPLITPRMVERLVRGLASADGVVAAAPVADTLKRANADGTVGATVDRAGLWGAQTPQVFRASVLRSVFDDADDGELDSATDCAGMAERRGIPIALIDPEAPNLKVTTPADLRLVEVLLGSGRIT
jgi:2-C-methyl-D-erythritol 4-phosphate cytidylyltransferase